MTVHAVVSIFNILLWILFSQNFCLFIRNVMRPVTDQWIMRRGLISECIGNNISLLLIFLINEQHYILRQYFLPGLVPCTLIALSIASSISVIFFIQIFCFNTFINSPFFYFSDECYTFIHSNCQWLCAAHAAEAGCYV